MKVAVLGASANPARYSRRALDALRQGGHEPVGVNPVLRDIDGVPVVAKLSELPPGVHTLTVYVGPDRSQALEADILAYGFERVIFNPGAENEALAERLRAAGANVQEACTLVLLATQRF
jgi:predicted CoA-binding protein